MPATHSQMLEKKSVYINRNKEIYHIYAIFYSEDYPGESSYDSCNFSTYLKLYLKVKLKFIELKYTFDE